MYRSFPLEVTARFESHRCHHCIGSQPGTAAVRCELRMGWECAASSHTSLYVKRVPTILNLYCHIPGYSEACQGSIYILGEATIRNVAESFCFSSLICSQIFFSSQIFLIFFILCHTEDVIKSYCWRKRSLVNSCVSSSFLYIKVRGKRKYMKHNGKWEQEKNY